MSNNDDDMASHAKAYHRAMKELREKNEERKTQWKDWEAWQGQKPSREQFDKMVGQVRTEQELHEAAKERADVGLKNEKAMREHGLMDRDQLEEKLGKEAVAKVEEKDWKRREEREQERQRGKDRGSGLER